MRIEKVLVLGGSGFVGRHLVNALARRSIRVSVPTRHRERAKHLLPLPTVDVVEADVFEPGTLERLALGAQVVVNLVGILHGRRGRADERGPNNYGPDFARVHVELPQAVVAACRSRGVAKLLHISANGASPDAPSEYLRSKAIGEQAVLAADDAGPSVFRPSVIFGPEDGFLNQFASLSRFLPVLAVPCPRAQMQPVYVGDVVSAMMAAMDDPQSRGKRFTLCGPRVYLLEEIVRFVCAATRRKRLVLGLPEGLSRLQARLMELAPNPIMSRDNVRSLQVPNVSDEPFPYGIEPKAMEGIAPLYLAPAGPRERYPQLRWRARR